VSAPHTPGPWTWEGHTLRPVNRDPRTSAVYSILHDDDGGFGFLGSKPSDTLAELDADRALIAAAPQLLRVLREVADFWAGGDAPPQLEAAIYAAIRSAEGRA